MATSHLTNFMRGQREMTKIQRNNCPHVQGRPQNVVGVFDITHAAHKKSLNEK